MKKKDTNNSIIYYYCDIECYQNYFLVCFKKYNTKEYITFELSSVKNELTKLRIFLQSSKLCLIGFNIKHYDNIILNYILSTNLINNNQIKKLSDLIITDKDNQFFHLYKKYTYKIPWISIDLFLFWSKMLRINKHISLKSLAVAINHPKIQELPYEPSSILTNEQIENIKSYCYNDVDIVENLTFNLRDKISLRYKTAQKLNDYSVLSYDDIKLGTSIVNTKFQEKGLNNLYDYKKGIDVSIFNKKINIKDIIFPYITFKTEVFQNVLNYYNNLVIYPRGEKFQYKFQSKGKIYSLGAGGIHSEENPEVFKSNNENIFLREKDVQSYYPNIFIRNNLSIPHLPLEFNEIYESIYNERIIAKQNKDNIVNETNKLALNGATGQLKDIHSPLCAPITNLTITINGQLGLLMLIEEAELQNIKIFCCNTDGVVFYISSKEDEEKIEKIAKEWEQKMNLLLEDTDYIKYFKRDVNNYLALTVQGKIKAKGIFNYKKPIIDDQSFLIIPFVLQKFLLEDVPVEQILEESKDIYKFCASYKVDKKYDVIYNQKKLQQLNRFYPSLNGYYLYKKKRYTNRNLEHLLADSSVIIFNNYISHKNFKDYNINYQYFSKKIYKILELFYPKTSQLKLEI